MVRFFRLLLGLVALIVIVAFAVANRTPVEVNFAPLPVTIELPLYGAFLFGLIVGVLVGGTGVWLGELSRRYRARRLRRRVGQLEQQLAHVRRQEEKAEAERDRAQRRPALQATGG
jgi:uncharacterized integral membrane protein